MFENHSNHSIKLIITFAIVSAAAGCKMANVVSTPLPTDVPAREKVVDIVPYYAIGTSMPPKGGIPFAQIGAHGNGYADFEYLCNRIAKKAAELGADFAIVYDSRTNQGPTITSIYGDLFSSTAISSTIQTLSVYGYALVNSPVSLGTKFDDKNVIIDITPDLSFARAGIKIGDRVLAIGGIRLTGDPWAKYRAINLMSPNVSVKIEVVGPDNTTRTVDCNPGPP
ncbi:MAG: hypothetical protein HY286_08000 [Planctomycetes bacterium]|nr:hypothetical protein [Planctomycetota bacterium]